MYHASYVPLQLMLQFTCSHIFEINSKKCYKNRKQYYGLEKRHEIKVMPKTVLKRAFGDDAKIINWVTRQIWSIRRSCRIYKIKEGLIEETTGLSPVGVPLMFKLVSTHIFLYR